MSGHCCKSIHRVLVPAGSALLLLAYGPCAQASVFTTLYAFGTIPELGPIPTSGVIMDSVGNMYGETEQGGTHSFGTVYKLTPAGVMTTLFSFGASDQAGYTPYGGLSLGAAGDLYGTTEGGGPDHYYGVAFKITPDGHEMVVHEFSAKEGKTAGGGVLDAYGNYFLATDSGYLPNPGSLLEFSPSGTETLLYQFQGKLDGSTPNGGLTLHDGTLYGTTARGGLSNGHGNVFSVTKPGTFRILYHFRFYKDGTFPNGSLVFDQAGNLYGTTENGGIGGRGTIFEVSPSGRKTTLHIFDKPDSTHNFTENGVVRDAAGNLYGTTLFGGSKMSGTIYKLAPDGAYTTLYSFPPSAYYGISVFPSSLSIDAQGNLYGTTQYGGDLGDGTIFKLTP